jgi:hypothetical protein
LAFSISGGVLIVLHPIPGEIKLPNGQKAKLQGMTVNNQVDDIKESLKSLMDDRAKTI